MPTARLERSGVLSLLPRVPSAEELVDALDRSKVEVSDPGAPTWEVEATPDRLDLLSEGGLGLALAGLLGDARGAPTLRTLSGGPPAPKLLLERSVGPQRPHLGALVVRSPTGAAIGPALLAEAIRYQELLHSTIGQDRAIASLGLYPTERLHGPIRYAREPIESVEFIPLGGSRPIGARAFLGEHPMAVRYGALGTTSEGVLTLRDADGGILSLPPILNARPLGEAGPNDASLLLESTGTRAGRVADALGLLSLVFVARGWEVGPIELLSATPTGPPRFPGARELELPEPLLGAIAGRPYRSAEVEAFFGRARLASARTEGGWSVRVPPWRPDLLHAVDLAEEVVDAEGIGAVQGRLPPSTSVGRRRPESRFRRRVAGLLLGSGFSELYSPVLASEELVERLGRTGALPIANPVSESFARVRDSLQIPLIASLGRNQRSGYPQRLFEVGPVVVADPRSPEGSATRDHAAGLLAGDGAGFSEAASVAGYLLATLGGAGVREPAVLPGTIPGRAASIRLAGEEVGEVGEIHPGVLDGLRVPVSAAWFELDLSALWPLVRRGGA